MFLIQLCCDVKSFCCFLSLQHNEDTTVGKVKGQAAHIPGEASGGVTVKCMVPKVFFVRLGFA